MGAIVTTLLYLIISLAVAGIVGQALSRSGRAFLAERLGPDDGVASAASRLLVVAFYLLAAGFIALTMPSWDHVGSTGEALRLLSGKLGEVLLVLGGLHLAATAVFARLRRARSWPPGADVDDRDDFHDSRDSGAPDAGNAGSGGAVRPRVPRPARYPAAAAVGPAAPAIWRPRRVH